MPAGSSDGSPSKATSASSPVLTSRRARGPDAQRATVWSKNGSTKRSAERSAQSTAGAGPEKSNLIGVQRSRSASFIRSAVVFRDLLRLGPTQPGAVVGEPDKEFAHNQRSGQLRLLRRSQPRQIADPKRLGAPGEEQHRGFVVGTGLD